MATSAVPAVIDALVTLSRAALPGVTVIDGSGTDFGTAGNYLLIGVDDPDRLDSQFAADAEQSWGPIGNRARNEVGNINCVAYSWTGNTDQKAVRDAAYATVAAVENLLRNDPTLGMPTVLLEGAQFGTTQQLAQSQVAATGSSARLNFQVHFSARI